VKTNIRQQANELGATMVEAAIGGLLVFFLIFMVIQGAFLARAYLAVRDAANSATRAGSLSANDANADYDILQAIDRSVSSTSRSNIEGIAVFNPQGPQLSIPPGCTSGPVTGMCNYYTAKDLSRPESDFEPGGSFVGDDYWIASSRSTSLATGLSHIGVYVRLKVGGLDSPLPQTMAASSVVELEPHS
jgi:hypothetical protein